MRRYRYKEAAGISGLSVRTIRYAVSSGELEARRCGRAVLIAEDALEEWLNGLPTVTAGGAA